MRVVDGAYIGEHLRDVQQNEMIVAIKMRKGARWTRTC
jgi:hypothetical protein